MCANYIPLLENIVLESSPVKSRIILESIIYESTKYALHHLMVMTPHLLWSRFSPCPLLLLHRDLESYTAGMETLKKV